LHPPTRSADASRAEPEPQKPEPALELRRSTE
jgi:hypothetical protein